MTAKSMSRAADIRITAALESGFIAIEAGENVAAFESAASAALWLENRLRRVDGDVRPEDTTAIEAYPNVFNASTGERKQRPLWGLIKGG